MRKALNFACALCVCLAAACGAALGQIEKAGPSAPAGAEAAKSAGYSDMLEFSHEAADYRMPTDAEIEKLGPLWPKVPPDKNAAYYFARATSLIAPYDKIPAGSMSGGEKGPYAGDVKAFDEWRRINERAFNTMKEGLRLDFCQLPVFIETKTQRPCVDPALLTRVRHLARTVADAGIQRELHGESTAAMDCYLEDLRLGFLLRHHGGIVTNTVGISLNTIALSRLDGLIVQGTLPATALRMILEQCRASESTADGLTDVWAQESALGKSLMESNKDIAVWKPFAAQVQAYYEAVGKVLAARSLPELLQHKVMEEFYRNDLKGFDDTKESGFSFQRWVFDMGRSDLSLRVTEIRAAIEIHKQQHNGAIPETLDVLCPAILPSVPVDPFSGKAMRYAKADYGWKVWSVGKDNIDHGGTSVSSPEWLRRGDHWRGPDYVFVSNVESNLEWLNRRR